MDLDILRKLFTPGASLKDDSEETAQPKRDDGKTKPQRIHRERSEIFVAVASKENYLICREKHIYAVKRSTHLTRVQKGDILVFYVTKISQFPGIYEVVREVYAANRSPFDSQFYRYHIDLKPIVEPPEAKWIKLADIKDRLEAVKDKTAPPGRFFQTILRTLAEKDYKFLLNKMVHPKK